MNSLYLIFCFVLAIGQCDEVKQMEALEDKLNRLIETLDLRDEKQYDLLTRKVETQQSEINFLRYVLESYRGIASHFVGGARGVHIWVGMGYRIKFSLKCKGGAIAPPKRNPWGPIITTPSWRPKGVSVILKFLHNSRGILRLSFLQF